MAKRNTVVQVAREAAEEDLRHQRYLALRRLASPEDGSVLSLGLLGPYEVEGSKWVVVFTEVVEGGKSFLNPSGGDRFQALNAAVEACRRQLVEWMERYPEGLREVTGEPYGNYDIPGNLVSRLAAGGPKRE